MIQATNLEALPEVQSYSSLRSYLNCQLKYWMLKGIPGVKRSASWASVGGRAVHELTHRWELQYSFPTQGGSQ